MFHKKKKFLIFLIICALVILVNLTLNQYVSKDQDGTDGDANDFDLLYHTDAVSDRLLDHELVLNRTKFTFTINPNYTVCHNASDDPLDVLLLAMVPISPEKFDARSLIRLTWSNENAFKSLRTVFVVGKIHNRTLEKRVQEEARLFNDIVQADFDDTYFNLTHKTIAGIKWASTYCSNARFLLKVDDDVVVNTGDLLAFLTKQTLLKPTFICHLNYFAHVVRDMDSKFFVSHKLYKFMFYPAYCDGPAYIMSMDLAGQLYHISRHFTFFPFEDIFTTGIIARKLQADYINLNQRYRRLIDLNIFNLFKYPFTKFFVYVSSVGDFLNDWKAFHENLHYSNGV